MPSPHRGPTSSWQVDEQPSQPTALPSSHCSGAQTTPSPQPVSTRQPVLQPSQSVSLPSSQSSPGSRTPSPQDGTRRHSALHRPGSGGSHSSPHSAFVTPSPQRSPVSIRHVDEQPSQSSPFPSSH